MDKPKCFSDESWDEWQFWNERTQGKDYAKTACKDCSPAYKAEMLAIDMCEDQRTGELPPLLPPRAAASRRKFRELEREAIGLVNRGYTQVAVAEALGVAQSTVGKWVSKARKARETA